MGAVVAYRGAARDAEDSVGEVDPLGLCAVVRDDDWPEDEYDSYGDVLASKLKRGNDREDIVSYLTKSLIDKDTIITPAWVARCEAAAAALIQWYAHSNAPR
jgi:hypothetical protein